jgi:hypothetical protein
MKRVEREAWHSAALERLAQADLVFLDPDNGIRVEGSSQSIEKYATGHEITDYTVRGQSIVIYQHADRSPGGVTSQLHRRMTDLRAVTGVKPLGGVIGRRGSVRFFMVLPASSHRTRLGTALVRYGERWYPHAEYRTFDGVITE